MKTILATGINGVNQMILNRFEKMKLQAEVTELQRLEYEMTMETDLVILNGYLEYDTGGGALREKLKDLKRKFPTARFVIILPEENETFRNHMASIGIYDVVETDDNADLSAEALFKAIEIPKTEIVKTKVLEKEIIKDSSTRLDFSHFIKQLGTRQTKVIGKQVISFWSPLPRGKTMLAAHMSLAVPETMKTVLIDGDELKPELDQVFKLKSDKTLTNSLELIQQGRFNYDNMEICLESHPKCSNLDVLFGFKDLQDHYHAKPEDIEFLLEKLLVSRDVLILDTNSYQDVGFTDVAMQMSNIVLIPSRANKIDIERINKYIDSFRKHGDVDVRKFRLVVNYYGGMDLTFPEVEALSKIPVAGYVPNRKKQHFNLGIDKKITKAMERIYNGL